MKKSVLLAIPTLLLALLAGAGIALVAFTPRWTPPSIPPNNSYIAVRDIGSQIPARPWGGGGRRNRPNPSPATNTPPSATAESFDFTAHLPTIRAALDTPGLVPVEVDPSWLGKHDADTRSLRQVHERLISHAHQLDLKGQTREAANTLLDAARFGAWSARGGLLSDRLLGIKMESKALDELTGLSEKLSAEDRAAVLAGIDALAKNWEPAESTIDREKGWAWARGSFQERVMLVMVRFLSNHPLRRVYDSAIETSASLDQQRAECKAQLSQAKPAASASGSAPAAPSQNAAPTP